jgi:hypothetical protein
MNKITKERFWKKVRKTDSCWLWVGCILKAGYGQFALPGGKRLYAHRICYEIYKGKIPKGLVLDHLCRVPSCVNPDHLEAVTMKVNILRGETITSMNSKKIHCLRGHKLSGKNLYHAPGDTRRRCRLCISDKYQKNKLKSL